MALFGRDFRRIQSDSTVNTELSCGKGCTRYSSPCLETKHLGCSIFSDLPFVIVERTSKAIVLFNCCHEGCAKINVWILKIEGGFELLHWVQAMTGWMILGDRGVNRGLGCEPPYVVQSICAYKPKPLAHQFWASQWPPQGMLKRQHHQVQN